MSFNINHRRNVARQQRNSRDSVQVQDGANQARFVGSGVPIECITHFLFERRFMKVSVAREQPLFVAGGMRGGPARWGVRVVSERYHASLREVMLV